MTLDEAWRAVAHECPRRIIPTLHRRGDYAHGTVPGLGGKVLCVHVSSTRPPGFAPTAAQAEAERADAAAECARRG